MRRTSAVLIFSATLFAAHAGYAQSLLYVSSAGYDGAAGTQTAPLKTITKAASLAKPGTTVMIQSGTYYEQVVTQVAGLSGQPVTFASYDGEVVLDGSMLPAELNDGREQNRGVVELRHPWTVLRGITIRNSPYAGVVLGASNLVVERNVIHDIRRHAISTDTRYQSANSIAMLTNLALVGNKVTRSVTRGLGYGQAISLIADGFRVEGNEVWNNHTEGIDVWLGARNGSVSGNDVHHNVRTGIYIDGAKNITVQGNRVHGNGAWTDGSVPGTTNGHGIGIASEDVRYATSDVRVTNNVSYANKRTGAFVWDQASALGYAGSQNVLIAYNTLIGNGSGPFYFSDGVGNTGEVSNNLYDGYESRSTEMDVHDNIKVSDLTVFANAGAGDFSLRTAATAQDRGVPFRSSYFSSFAVKSDFNNFTRVNAPDTGAFEYGSTVTAGTTSTTGTGTTTTTTPTTDTTTGTTTGTTTDTTTTTTTRCTGRCKKLSR